MRGVGKRFGSVRALDGVDLEVRRGEVHALLGENGAGKTTLMRILAGLERPDGGTVSVLGSPVTVFSPGLLRDRGVALVQQHFTLVSTFTAGENLVLSRPAGWRRPGPAAVRARVDALASRYDLPVRSDVPVAELSVGEQQRLELLRALDADASVLVLDEPTAVLTDAEADRLLRVCRSLADEDRTVIVITHRLREVFAGCDRVTVLRAGRVVVGGAPVSDHTPSSLAQAMVGAETPVLAPEVGVRTSTSGARTTLVEVRGVRCGALDGLDLVVGAGEVVGVAGVDGNGQAELEALLSGRRSADAGDVLLDGEPWPATPRRRVAAGIGYIPSDRYRYGLAGPLDLADNLALGRTPGWRRARRVRRQGAAGPLRRWDVRSAGPQAAASSLSGGNAQKLVLARELPDGGEGPAVVLACYATRGLDPHAARLVIGRVVEQAERGAAVLWIGAELDELLTLVDRLVVLTNGRVAGEFVPPYDREAIGLAMSGAGATVQVGA
jgi:simple sugar transport system ATP-binding protein